MILVKQWQVDDVTSNSGYRHSVVARGCRCDHGIAAADTPHWYLARSPL